MQNRKVVILIVGLATIYSRVHCLKMPGCVSDLSYSWTKNIFRGYDSSQIPDLVGLYMLDILTRIISPEQIGLYRYDGLIYIPNSNGPNSSSAQKRIIRAFKFLEFKREVSSNNKIVNFLDVTLDLSNNTYKSFIKTDQSPSYINVHSNHPKTIIKQVPKRVNLRIRNLSANEKIFLESSKIYMDAL